ncbi:hypothetical protein [Saccharopolyspora spinosa]|uniref:hypothetical protein n=1 Tax=Saccharopolyspora spinosa TaxID=60894 RepID=UPI000237AE9D|nr:hypothetical protein [Saccharopolyspora spinosa]
MMANDHDTVLATMIFDLVAPAGVIAPVGVELRYDSRNPYEISMKLNAEPAALAQPVMAQFSRNRLDANGAQ